MLAATTSGCMLAAVPLAIEAAEGVGSVMVNGTIAAVSSAHQGPSSQPDTDHPGEDKSAREDRCSELAMDAPNVIELHKDGAGKPEYRELHLSDSLSHPQWQAIVDQETNIQGWRPAVNFLQMEFTPPLGPLPDNGSDYIAYRAPQSGPGPDIEFVPLSVNFTKTQGTFRWNGELYHYALSRALPCFPPPK